MSQRLKGDEDLVAQLHMLRTLRTQNSHYIHSFMEIVGFSQSIPSKHGFDKLDEVEIAIKKEGLALQHAARELRCEPLVVMRAMKRPWDFGFEVKDLPPKN